MTNFEKVVQGGADALHRYRITRNCGKICANKGCKHAGGDQSPFNYDCHIGQYRWLISPTNPELIEDERSLLKGMELAGYPWVAKDENGIVYFFTSKPIKRPLSTVWGKLEGNHIKNISNFTLDFIQWSDPEPINITELLDSGK